MKKILIGLIVVSMHAARAEHTAFVGAKIYDGENYLNADTMIVQDGLIADLGLRASLAKKVATATKVIDLKGSRVLPGFIESHAHLISLGQSKINVDFRGLSLKEIVRMLKERVNEEAPGTWIVGRNWDQNTWENKKYPSAAILDEVTSSHPVFLKRVDGHAAWVNTVALKKAGITRASKDPSGGKIERNRSLEPSGILIDNAMSMITAVMAKPSRAELLRYLQLASEEALSFGITSLHDAGADADTIDLYKELAESSKLKLRIYAMLDGSDDALVKKHLSLGPTNIKDWLNIRSIKYFADGALGSHGALLLEDYFDKAGSSGLSLIDPALLREKTTDALAKGFQVCTHAIGDRANREVLNAYELALKNSNAKDARLRIEHAQLVDRADHQRFSRLGVIASMQPVHCTSDMSWVPNRLGANRLKDRAFPWRSLLDANTILSFGSDAPVEKINPLLSIYAAVTRENALNRSVFMPEQILSLKEALRGFFAHAAKAEFSEHKKGHIAKGFLADFVVFPQDILNLSKTAFLVARPSMTVVGGEVAYEALKQ